MVSSSFDHSLIDQARVFRSLPVYDYPWRIAASVTNGGRRMALRGVQYLCFFEHARLIAAAQRRNSAIGRRILLPSVAKAILIFRKIIEGELRYPARAKATTDSPRDLVPTAAWPNVNWNLPGVALLVIIAGGRLARAHAFLN